jgi:TonB family protein
MRKPSFAFCVAVFAFTVNARAATPPVTSTQDVRFTEKTIPNGIVAPPQILDHPNPAYTNEARRRGIQGSVNVLAQFDADGNFKVLRIVRGLGHGLDENALAALQNWRFAPAVKNGQRVSVIAEIEIPFRMPDLERI